MVIVSAVLTPLLALAGVPLLRMSSKYYVDTGASTTSVQTHWTLWLAAAVLVAGLALALLPERSPKTDLR